MRCPFCKRDDSKVLDSRESAEGTVTRRRRECLGCHKRFTTYERVEELMPLVVKKDGRREPYDREKLISGLVGEEVMRRLRALDQVAYVRFASVYRSFRDIEEFMDELKGLLDDHGADATRRSRGRLED